MLAGQAAKKAQDIAEEAAKQAAKRKGFLCFVGLFGFTFFFFWIFKLNVNLVLGKSWKEGYGRNI